MKMSPIAKEEFTTRIKACSPEQKDIIAELIPTRKIEEELERRYHEMAETLENIAHVMQPYLNGEVNDYTTAMNTVKKVTAVIKSHRLN